jgi:pimeloyl-ACP methyl ester carboxylesterase
VRVSEGRRPGLAAAIVVGIALATFAPSAPAAEFSWMPGYDDPATPDSIDRVGVLKVGPERAKNVLVLNPGTSAGAAYFKPLAEDVVSETDGRWQVWSVERRENQLEDHSLLDRSKLGTATPQEVFDYYLGWLVDPSVTDHFQLVPDSSVAFARGWGMNVEVQDLRRVVQAARAGGRRVVLGGHSLGGSITTAYATWDFKGRPAARDVSGLVYIDGASNPTPITPAEARQSLQDLQNGSPWLAFGGIPAPFLGIFSAAGSTATVVAPDAASLGWSFPLVPANLKPPVQPTNEAQFAYAVDTETSPPSLAAAQVHAGRLAASGSPRGWERAGEITPIQRYADMLSGTRLTGVDGGAWYQPMRLTIDSRAVANGNAHPAQSVLGVKATHGDDLSKHTPIYAFGASLGGEGVLEAARLLARQSDIPDNRLTLVNREATYAHNDPSSASPQNEFLDQLIPFLAEIAKR